MHGVRIMHMRSCGAPKFRDCRAPRFGPAAKVEPKCGRRIGNDTKIVFQNCCISRGGLIIGVMPCGAENCGGGPSPL